MLCAVCISMFQKNDKHGMHHKNYEALAKAAKNGCKICNAIKIISSQLEPSSPIYYTFEWTLGWRHHWHIGFSGEKKTKIPNLGVFVHVSEATSVPYGYNLLLESAKSDLEGNETRVRRDVPRMRDIPDNTGHEAVADMAKQWLQNCKCNHTCDKEHATQEIGWYPERLVYVGSVEEQPRLVLREERPEGPYAALSHCWGDDPKFMVLTTTNIEDFRQEIPLEEVAASFRDAIVTCRRLDIPYIWIDSLCILQSGGESQEDWLHHSGEMHKVYQNCELNIAIHDAANPEQGAFRSRDTDFLQDCYVWTPFHKPPKRRNSYLGEDDEPIVREDSDTEDGEYVDGKKMVNVPVSQDGDVPFDKTYLCAIFTEADFSYSRRDSPLTQRAWVLQEKLLSPRTLHFQADRIAWECNKLASTEYLLDSVANEEFGGFDCLFQTQYNIRTRGLGQRTYFDYVMEYADATLSYPDEDKLVAFAAIARRWGEHFENDYCAGLFRSQLPHMLLWDVQLWANPSPRRSATYRAPSWSWASIDGRIGVGALTDGDFDTFATVEDVQVKLVDPLNQYGQVASASLTLTGPLIPWEDLINLSTTNEDDKREDDANLYGPEYIHAVNGELQMKSILGVRLELTPDDHPNGLGGGRIVKGLIRNCIGDTKDVSLVAVADLLCPKRIGSWTGCYGLVLRRLEDGSYTRLALWKGEHGFLGKHADTKCVFRKETITIV